MKLKQIELAGFGKLVNQVFEFGPGLNVIYGQNEAGKSTLQRSIFAALYGFFDDGSITVVKKAAMRVYEPWDRQAPFGLKLVFDLEKGTQYRVERIFLPKPETVLYDAKSGRSINTKFPSASQGRLFFAEQLFGMSREVFENTCLVRQAELTMLEESASAITDTLLRLSASASQESTVSQALEILETTLKEQIGTPRSRNKPLPEAQRRLEALQVARTHLQSEHHMLANQMHELAQMEESFERLEYERDKAEFLQLLAERLATQQELSMIKKADGEIARFQQDVAKYQTWASFPAESQPKIQRLAAQLEKTRSYSDQAEQVARQAKQHLFGLQTRLNELRKRLNITEPSPELPDVDNRSAGTAGTAVKSWLDNEFSSLGNVIQERQNALALNEQRLAGLLQIGHEGLIKARQELGKLESDLAQEKRTLQQIQQRAMQAGLPEAEWGEVLSDAQSKAETTRAWSTYPAHLRDELLQLTAQYLPLRQSLADKSEQITALENQLDGLQEQIRMLLQEVSSLENVRNLPHQERHRIKEIASQLEFEKEATAEAYQRFIEIDDVYRKEQQALQLEKQTVEPLERLGMFELTQLQQNCLNATRQRTLAHTRFKQSEEAWNRVGMAVSEFQRLEEIAKEIQSGAGPVPKRRPGCLSWFMSWFGYRQTKAIDQTPNEIMIYTQIQPIYAEYVHKGDEFSESERILESVERELRQKLGQLIPETIQEDMFADLVQQLQSHQRKVAQSEQQKGRWNSLQTQYQQAESRVGQIQLRLEKELQSYGFTGQSIDEALVNFLRACEEKERLIATETELDRLNSQCTFIKRELEQSQRQQQTLSQIEGKIIDLLAKANIDTGFESLQEGIRRFEDGLEHHRQWREAQSRLDQIQKQIDEYQQGIFKAQSTVRAKEEMLFQFRIQLIDKLPGLLVDDFNDQHLSQIDTDLRSYNSAQLELDKVRGQIEQLQLQAQAIQRDLDDWVEKNETTKHLEIEILQAIHETGIKTDQMSVETALDNFSESFQNFSYWREAKHAYDSAVSAQQKVRTTRLKLETEDARLASKLVKTLKQHSEWKNLIAKDKSEVYEQNVKKLNGQILQERDRLIRLQDTISKSTANLRHLAEIEEEIDLVNKEIEELTKFSQALELASSELIIATQEFQKIFAPRLERVVEYGLEQITNGRYHQAKIDPNSLNVQVLAPERNEFVDTTQLSTGTRDLIYLVLRIGLAQLMSNTGEKFPLLLDDPLVEFDAVRLKACLDYLKNLSTQTQILLFTKDGHIRDWCHENKLDASSCRLIELG